MMENGRKEKENFMVENQGAFPSNAVNWILGCPVKGSMTASLFQTIKKHKKKKEKEKSHWTMQYDY